MKIPANIFSKFDEVTDLMRSADVFGRTCKLVFESVVTTTTTVPSIKRHLTMSPPAGIAGSLRGSESTKTVETTEEIILRVYWSKKDFSKIGNILVPEGGCLTICEIGKLESLAKAKFLLVYTDIEQSELKMAKLSEPVVYGLSKKEAICFWSRV